MCRKYRQLRNYLCFALFLSAVFAPRAWRCPLDQSPALLVDLTERPFNLTDGNSAYGSTPFEAILLVATEEKSSVEEKNDTRSNPVPFFAPPVDREFQLSLLVPEPAILASSPTALFEDQIDLPAKPPKDFEPIVRLLKAASQEVASKEATLREAEVAVEPTGLQIARLPDRGPLPIDPVSELDLSTDPVLTEPVAEGENQVVSDEPVSKIEAERGEAKNEGEEKGESTVAEAPPEPLLPEPKTLLFWLDRLRDDPQTRPWAQTVCETVSQFRHAWGHRPEEAFETAKQFETLVDEADRLALKLEENSSILSALCRAGYALQRRASLWTLVADYQHFDTPIGQVSSTKANGENSEPDRFSLALADVQTYTENTDAGKAWQDYLLLETLEEIAVEKDKSKFVESQKLARDILSRMEDGRLDELQRSYLKKGPFRRLKQELRGVAGAPLDYESFLARLERYEQTGLPSEARRLAETISAMEKDVDDPHHAFYAQMDAHYRNANLRILLDEQFLNRLMPDREPQFKPVNDRILGRPVHGRSKVNTNLGVTLIPDPNRLRLALEIQGTVFSSTSSNSGPVTFLSRSRSQYYAQKPIEITNHGIQLWPAEVHFVNNKNRLTGMETPFDRIPLLAPLVHEIAESQHQAKRPEIRREVEWKVAAEAKQQFDEEADTQLLRMNDRFQNRLLATLDRLDLKLTPVETRTTENELSMRFCLASDRQLGSHTPRPQALDDRLANIQIHQTVLNNLIEQLELDGKTFILPELAVWLSERLSRPELTEAKGLKRDDVRIRFARESAVYVKAEDGRLALTLTVAELRAGRRRWRNFQVRVFYRPEIDGLQVNWVRDGVVQLTGRRVQTSSQFALRGIFSRIFLKNKPFSMIPEQIVNNPNLQGLTMTQMEIVDGWIGLTVGEEPGRVEVVAQRP